MSVRGPDLYPTPAEVTRALLKIEELPEHLWEPAAGMGHMVVALVEAGHVVFASDLIAYRPVLAARIKTQDFFEFKTAPAETDCIVTNPPFGDAVRFVRHALKLCRKVCILQRLAFLEGVRRSDILDQRLARLYPLIERVEMMHRWSQGIDGIWHEWKGKRADNAMPFAWFVFESDHDGARDGFSGRRVSWREPGSKRKQNPRG